MTTQRSLFRSRLHRHVLTLSLLSCGLTSGCQTPGFSTALSGKKATAQPVSSTEEAGLPEPTNTATSNSPLSLSSVEEHLRLGEEELSRGNYQQAQMHFDHVLEKHPDHVKAHHRLGVLADKLSQFEQAEQHYLTALNGDPRNAALLSDLGYSYFMQGRNADAERYLLEARKLDPNYETAVANLGLLYGSTGRKQEALAMFRQIGDDEQVQAIMQQIAGGQFDAAGQVADSHAAAQSSVFTTQTSVQQAVPVPAHEMNDATRDFVEQLRQAREELQRAEQELAQHRQQTRDVQLAQSAANQQVAPQQSAQQSPWTSQPAPQQQSPWHNNRQMMPQGQPVPDGALSNAMASIDRQNAPYAGNAPIVIGQQQPAGNMPVVSPGPSQAGQPSGEMHQNVQQTAGGSQVPVYTGSGPQQFPANANPQQPPAGRQPQPQSPGASTWGQQTSPAAQNSFSATSGSAASAIPPSAWGQQFAASVDQQASQNGMNPSGNIQQAAAGNQSWASQPVEHAHHTQAPQHSQNIALAGQNGAVDPSLVPPQANGNWGTSPQAGNAPAGVPAQAPAPNSYDAARREAALLGLNAGPGQVFPYIQQSQRVMPGTDSRVNGAQYPAPVRHMPAGLTPPQIIPGGAQQPLQAYQRTPRQPATDPYQDTRMQQSQQLNGLVNQTWGQSPQSPPYGVTPPSTTQHYNAGNVPAPAAAGVTPVPYYQRSSDTAAQQATPAGYQTRQPTTNYAAAPQAAGGVVVPEAYPNQQAPASGNQQMPVNQGQPYHQPAPYSGPTIVPGERY